MGKLVLDGSQNIMGIKFPQYFKFSMVDHTLMNRERMVIICTIDSKPIWLGNALGDVYKDIDDID